MNGIDKNTGKRLSGDAHLRQSITDILTTPIGSRVMRREYGSRIFELIDNPVNQGLVIDVIQAAAEALSRWEPRIKVLQIKGVVVDSGRVEFDLDYVLLASGQVLTMEGVSV